MYPLQSPSIVAAISNIMMMPMFNSPAPHTTPIVNSKESPGRKNPTKRPVSANTIAVSTAYPAHPVMTVDRSWINRSGVVSVRRKSRIV